MAIEDFSIRLNHAETSALKSLILAIVLGSRRIHASTGGNLPAATLLQEIYAALEESKKNSKDNAVREKLTVLKNAIRDLDRGLNFSAKTPASRNQH